jgi:hypothetical protein
LTLPVFTQEQKNTVYKASTDIELLEDLSSQDRELSDAAIEEVLKRGERMIPLLIQKKGDQRFVIGTLTRNINAAQVVFSPLSDKKANKRLLSKGKLVTVEVAALYLITAIYYNDLYISQSPYLTDYSVTPIKQRAANTSKVIKKAWESTEKWYQRLKIEGLEKLRKDKEDPFTNSDVGFW